ncbi:hypothetical protein I9D91_09070 [Campylobacter jejuni]|nr:hypothetical protein [Campylobacter jejuni]
MTATIINNGYVLSDIKVIIIPKPKGQIISYNVNSKIAKTYSGIYIFGKRNFQPQITCCLYRFFSCYGQYAKWALFIKSSFSKYFASRW